MKRIDPTKHLAVYSGTNWISTIVPRAGEFHCFDTSGRLITKTSNLLDAVRARADSPRTTTGGRPKKEERK